MDEWSLLFRFFETSVRSGQGIEEIFAAVCKKVTYKPRLTRVYAGGCVPRSCSCVKAKTTACTWCVDKCAICLLFY